MPHITVITDGSGIEHVHVILRLSFLISLLG